VRGRPAGYSAARFSGLAIVLSFGVVGPLITSYRPEEANPAAILLPPSGTHWFGTDNNGADVFARVVYAARTDILIGCASVGIAFVMGVMLGAFAGSGRRVWSSAIIRVTDFVQ
jgi:peptide/nickel transport system permease protein